MDSYDDKNNCVSVGKVQSIYIFQVYGEDSLKTSSNIQKIL